MVNIYSIKCDLFPQNKIIEILKFNNFNFIPQILTPREDFNRHLSYNEDKMWYIKKAIILNSCNFQIIIGNTFRDNISKSAFQIYFPNQPITVGFNYNPEFSKKLIAMDDFDLKSSSPILSITLSKKNLEKLINENDITFSNVQESTTNKIKSINFEEVKKNGIEKIFLFKHEDFFIVIGWLLQGRKKRNTVIYNKSFTDILTGIKSVELKIPDGFGKKIDSKKINKKYITEKENYQKQSGDLALKCNIDLAGDKFVSPFKNNPKYKSNNKMKLWMDNTPNIDKINTILEKISRSGITSLSFDEITFLKDNSEDI